MGRPGGKRVDQIFHAILCPDGTGNGRHDREQDRKMRTQPPAQIAHHEREWAVCVSRKIVQRIVHVFCQTCWRLTGIVSGPPVAAFDHGDSEDAAAPRLRNLAARPVWKV
jgi:hypothetical protein